MLAAFPLTTAGYLVAMAPSFAWNIRFGDRPILQFIGGMTLLSIVFVGLVLRLQRRPTASPARAGSGVALVFIAGLIARLVLLPTTPILEDDHYRYLWDGAVTAAGQNPYAYPPARFVSPPGIAALLDSLALDPTPPPPGFEQLTADGQATLVRINNPHIATIYPPPAQLAFAIGHWLTPWRIEGWKLVILAAETIAFALLLGGLRAAGLPMPWAAIYWWNPLVLKEFANSGHMDALLMPLLAGALWMLLANRLWIMAGFIACAGAVKFWPLLIAPVLMRRSRAAVVAGGMVAVIAMALLLPQLLQIGPEAGLNRYTLDWERNALAFPLLAAALGPLVSDPAGGARLIVAAVLIGLVVRRWFRAAVAPRDRLATAGTVVLLLCLLSPTGYPWYSLWLAPFAVFQPRLSWVLLMAAAPAYYLGFWFQLHASEAAWRWIAPLLSAGPAWLALIREWDVAQRVKTSADG